MRIAVMYLCLLFILPLYQYSSTMSFIDVAEDSDFSYQNLPYGIFSTPSNVSVKPSLSNPESSISLQLFLHVKVADELDSDLPCPKLTL